MSDPYKLLGVALLRVNLATYALEATRKAVEAAAGSFVAAEKAREVNEPDGWPPTQAEFGAAVRRAREIAGLTRAELATRTGLAEATIRNVEGGRHKYSAITRALLVKTLVPVPS
jgi:ribosome-binding protein aMBF1 (putative translation factor)